MEDALAKKKCDAENGGRSESRKKYIDNNDKLTNKFRSTRMKIKCLIYAIFLIIYTPSRKHELQNYSF